MKHFRLAIGYALRLVFFAAAGYRPKPKSPLRAGNGLLEFQLLSRTSEIDRTE